MKNVKFSNQEYVAIFGSIIFMTDNKSKSIGSTEKLDLSLESPPDAGYLSVCYFQRAPNQSGLINNIGYFWLIIQKVLGAQKRLTYRWKALKTLDIYPWAILKWLQAKVG